MPPLTLEQLAQRLTDLERKVDGLAGIPPTKDWRRTVGMFEGSEFMARVESEILAEREAERQSARAGIDE